MFTGIIEQNGIITELNTQANILHICIQCNYEDIQEGESIAVDGICLTAIKPEKGKLSCDISPETLELTTAKEFIVGRNVHLERALRVGDRLGGHWVTGHVDQRGMVQKIIPQESCMILQIGNIENDSLPYLVKKGSIAIDGVSLTINQVFKDGFNVTLIPHTLNKTHLCKLKIDDSVNLEFDYLAKLTYRQTKLLYETKLS